MAITMKILTVLSVIVVVTLARLRNDDATKEILNQVVDILGNGLKIDNSQYKEGEEFDFIIVGAGSAGCVIANRLSEIADWKILLLEAGGPETNFSKTPMMAPLLHFTPFNWAFQTEPEKNACQSSHDHRCPWPRGKALGGTSAINFMLYYRGNPIDYDRWAALNNPGWSYDEVLPYFLKSEDANFEDADPKYHNSGGYLHVTAFNESVLSEAFVEAGHELGYKQIDPNTRETIGFSKVYATIRNKKRHSASSAFLEPVLERKNLKIVDRAHVTKILIEPTTKRAYGVQYVRDNTKIVAKAKKEVILSAGVLGSPKLLMLSGVGPKEHLLDVGIAPIADSPVGQTLYDHVMYFGLIIETNHSEIIDVFNKADDLQFVPLTSGIGYIATEFSDSDHYPDIEIHLMPHTFASKLGKAGQKFVGVGETTYNTMYKKIETKNTIAILPKLIRPKSVGRMKLKSNDPYDYPLFYPNYFTDPEDVDKKRLIAGIRFVHRLIETQPFKKFNLKVYDKQFVGCEDFVYNTDEYWDCALKSMTVSGFHQTSTSKMGPEDDPTAVVDHDLQVYGIRGLRVADNGVVPQPICSHLNAPTIMIGEKAADLVKEKWGKLRDNSIEKECKYVKK